MRSVVLCYHAIEDRELDPMLLAVSPARFAEHLQAIRELATPASLSELVEGRSTPGARIAVTFDDGYVNNLTVAKPLLAEAGIPGTVFIVSGYVGREEEAWWDELDRILLSPGSLPRRLEIGTLSFELGDDARYDTAAAVRDAWWNVLASDDPTARHTVYRRLAAFLKAAPEQTRASVLRSLREQSGGTPAARPERRLVDRAELAALGGDGIGIGAHTRTHPALPDLSAAAQQAEIAGSRADLEEWLGRPVTAFAYPYGGSSRLRRIARTIGAPRRYRADATASVARRVRASGFTAACATTAGAVDGRTSPWLVPRLVVRNWTGAELAERIRRAVA